MKNDFPYRETLVRSEHIFTGRVVRLVVDTVRLPDGRETTREVVHHHGAVGLVPVTETGDVILVRQWRHAAGRAMLEIPAGTLSPGEDPEECARRELAEEIGQAPGRLERLTTLFTSPGYVAEAITIYLARDLQPQEAESDEDENLQIVPLSLAKAVQMCHSGEICDGKTIAALLLARDVLAQEAK